MPIPHTLIAAGSPAPQAGTVPLGIIAPASDAYSKGSETQAGSLTNLELLIGNIIGFITILGGVFFLVHFFMGALHWIHSENDKSKLEKARGEMIGAAVGIIIMVAAYSAVGWIGTIVGVNILNPGAELRKIIPGGGGSSTVPSPTP